jgi:hypothetical protein
MAKSSYTMKAYWRVSEKTDCTVCKKTGVQVEEPGRKQRGKMDWWTECRYCAKCREQLPDVAPE